MSGKWDIFTVSSDTRLWHFKFHARFWRWMVLNLLHGDLPAWSPCAFLVLILFLYHLSHSHFINFTYPVSIPVSRGSYSSPVSLQVPVRALYIWCLPLSFLIGLAQVLQVKTPIVHDSHYYWSQLTGRSAPSLIFPLVSLSNHFSITLASLDISFPSCLCWFWLG